MPATQNKFMLGIPLNIGTPTTQSVPVPAPVTQPPIIVQESQTPPFIKQESTSSHGSLVISQEEPEYETASGGGYYGYLGSDSHSAQPAQYSQLSSGYSPTTSAPMYAQSSWMSPPRSSQQMQGFGGYDKRTMIGV
ncbi:hypothetical protein Ddc_12480 [Ditylenchus destructor]|nr:hypothetical protein Ddc_12480 [Ditylenchus destructor]